MRAATLILALALVAAGGVWDGAAFADAPSRSPFPRARPVVDGAPASGLVSITDAAVAEALGAVTPRPRPGTLAPPPSAASPPSATSATPASVSRLAVAQSPRPRPRPGSLRLRVPAPAASVTARPVAPDPAPTASGDTGRLCGVRGLSGARVARVTSRTQGCGIDEAVRITAVQGIPLSPAATVHCDTARAFDTWVRQSMIPAMGNSGGGVSQITIGSHYACRPRNNQAGARMSEHGRGMAIDVMGFRLANGETVTVREDYRRGRYRRALQRMYREACGTFRTTLGPDADRYHQDHFHFDLARHRGGGTYCR